MTRLACEHLGVEVAGHDDGGADVDVWMDGWDDVARRGKGEVKRRPRSGSRRGREGGCKSRSEERRGKAARARAELGRSLVA